MGVVMLDGIGLASLSPGPTRGEVLGMQIVSDACGFHVVQLTDIFACPLKPEPAVLGIHFTDVRRKNQTSAGRNSHSDLLVSACGESSCSCLTAENHRCKSARGSQRHRLGSDALHHTIIDRSNDLAIVMQEQIGNSLEL